MSKQCFGLEARQREDPEAGETLTAAESMTQATEGLGAREHGPGAESTGNDHLVFHTRS